jgi:serpin B
MGNTRRLLDEVSRRGYVELSIANSLWPQQGIAVNAEFLLLAERYMTEVNPVDYQGAADAARDAINQWGARHTNDRIKEIIHWDLNSLTFLLLANAIYFKGNWASQFDEARTSLRPFHLPNGNVVEVQMMRQLGEFGFGWQDFGYVLEMPYVGEDLSMFVILPHDYDGLQAVERTMTGDDLVAWAEQMHREAVYVHLPRFRIESAFNMIDHGDLAGLGITRALQMGEADFSGMTDNTLHNPRAADGRSRLQRHDGQHAVSHRNLRAEIVRGCQRGGHRGGGRDGGRMLPCRNHRWNRRGHRCHRTRGAGNGGAQL